MKLTLENELEAVTNKLLDLLEENEDILDEPYMILIENAFNSVKSAKQLLVNKYA